MSDNDSSNIGDEGPEAKRPRFTRSAVKNQDEQPPFIEEAADDEEVEEAEERKSKSPRLTRSAVRINSDEQLPQGVSSPSVADDNLKKSDETETQQDAVNVKAQEEESVHQEEDEGLEVSPSRLTRSAVRESSDELILSSEDREKDDDVQKSDETEVQQDSVNTASPALDEIEETVEQQADEVLAASTSRLTRSAVRENNDELPSLTTLEDTDTSSMDDGIQKSTGAQQVAADAEETAQGEGTTEEQQADEAPEARSPRLTRSAVKKNSEVTENGIVDDGDVIDTQQVAVDTEELAQDEEAEEQEEDEGVRSNPRGPRLTRSVVKRNYDEQLQQAAMEDTENGSAMDDEMQKSDETEVQLMAVDAEELALDEEPGEQEASSSSAYDAEKRQQEEIRLTRGT